MLDIDNARSVSEYLLHSTRESFTDIIQLMHYPDYDSYTVGHSVRVATLAVHLGDKLGLAEEDLLELGTAGLLHDVGKSKIPDEILFKPGRLDKEEFAVMQSHARLGAEILLEHKTATPMDVAAAWGHHLRYDGGGYPEAPAWARRDGVTALLQVCDVFEALTAIRPYKAPMTPSEAYGIMLKDEGAFDPAMLNAFIRTLGLYPPGNLVRLTDGRQGTVSTAGADIERPVVKVLLDAAGRELTSCDQETVDLAVDDGRGLAVAELLADGVVTVQDPSLTPVDKSISLWQSRRVRGITRSRSICHAQETPRHSLCPRLPDPRHHRLFRVHRTGARIDAGRARDRAPGRDADRRQLHRRLQGPVLAGPEELGPGQGPEPPVGHHRHGRAGHRHRSRGPRLLARPVRVLGEDQRRAGRAAAAGRSRRLRRTGPGRLAGRPRRTAEPSRAPCRRPRRGASPASAAP